MDVAARLEGVENENDMLRARVAQLEEMIGFHAPCPIVFGFTGSEARLFGVLMKRDIATCEMAMLALYGNRLDGGPERDIVKVFICKMRAKLRRFEVPIETVWGQGFRLLPETKARVRALMIDEGLAA